MHARGQILTAIVNALEGAGSPPVPVYEEDETATVAPSFQYAVGSEEPVDAELTRGSRSRSLSLSVAARGTTLAERETLAEQLELGLLDGALGTAFDVILGPTALKKDSSGGQRIYSATYSLEVRYNTRRGTPGTLG
jgi:hypothetical protein